MVDTRAAFERAFRSMPLVAILRGVHPGEVLGIADALIDAGFTLIEVPLNSPDPFESIARLVAHCPSEIIIGAGTVLHADDAIRLANVGARLMVAPNTDPEVITAGKTAGLIPLAGCMTPSEALKAITCGAAGLKVFPANNLKPSFAKDLKATLPKAVHLVAVGGIGITEMPFYRTGGYDGFGFGSSLYAPGRTPSEVGKSARKLVETWIGLAGD